MVFRNGRNPMVRPLPLRSQLRQTRRLFCIKWTWRIGNRFIAGQHVFYARPSAHLRSLATCLGAGTISRSSDIARFVQGGVVKTFRWADEPVKTHLVYISLVLILLFVACWGWFNAFGAQAVGRGNVREASYLASEFTSFCIENDRLPTADEAAVFSTRLCFVNIRDNRYTFRCGLYARDHLILERHKNGSFEFTVHGNASN